MGWAVDLCDWTDPYWFNGQDLDLTLMDPIELQTHLKAKVYDYIF